MATVSRRSHSSHSAPTPPVPLQQAIPIIHGDIETLRYWLAHYWQKLCLPSHELPLLAMTQDRQEYMRWTGKRLNTMALGCYCYLPAPNLRQRRGDGALAEVTQQHRHLIFIEPDMQARSVEVTQQHRHLIFIEPDMQARSVEVTVAHELIHLADRVNGTPRRHRHHGYDSIASDEAAITGYGLEELRVLLHEESVKREQMRRERRPIRYLYACPNCGKEYPRTRRYSQAVSCSSCDKSYNPRYRLLLKAGT